MNQGDVIAVRGTGPRRVRLLFEAVHDGIDYGVIENEGGDRTRPSPVVAMLARGYWKAPDAESGPRPVAKHGTHNQLMHGNRSRGGIDRADMPQIPRRFREKFLDELSAEGVSHTDVDVDPRSLRRTQRGLNPDNVRSMYDAMKQPDFDDKGHRIIVSRDNKVLDGHHRWAAAAQIAQEKPGFTIGVTRIDMPMSELLARAASFNEENSIESRSMEDVGPRSVTKHGTHNQQDHAGSRRPKKRVPRPQEKPRSEPLADGKIPVTIRSAYDQLKDPETFQEFSSRCDRGGGCEDVASAVEERFGLRAVQGTWKAPDGAREYHAWNEGSDGSILDAYPLDGDGLGPRAYPSGASQYEVEGFLEKSEFAKHGTHNQRSHGRRGGYYTSPAEEAQSQLEADMDYIMGRTAFPSDYTGYRPGYTPMLAMPERRLSDRVDSARRRIRRWASEREQRRLSRLSPAEIEEIKAANRARVAAQRERQVRVVRPQLGGFGVPALAKAFDPLFEMLERVLGDVVEPELWIALIEDGSPVAEMSGPLGDLLDEMLLAVLVDDAVVKHLQGQHDQQTHGKGGSGGGESPTPPTGSRDGDPFGSDYDREINYYLQEPNPPAVLYHVAPKSARDDIARNGLDAGQNTWNTGASMGDEYRDEHLWTKGEDGEDFAYEYRPEGIYMFSDLGRAKQYAEGNNGDIYQIDTEINNREIIRDPSQAVNWEYEDPFDHAYVTRYVEPNSLTRLDVSKHLSGQHDQQSHGKGRSKEALSAITAASEKQAKVGRVLDDSVIPVDGRSRSLAMVGPLQHLEVDGKPQYLEKINAQGAAAIITEQGWDAPAQKVDKETFEALATQGDFVRVYRGGPRGLEEGMINGTPYIGDGIFGPGTYVSTDRSIAQMYVLGGVGEGSLVPMLMPRSMATPTARPAGGYDPLSEYAMQGSGAILFPQGRDYLVWNTGALIVGPPETDQVVKQFGETGNYYKVVQGRAVPLRISNGAVIDPGLDVSKHLSGQHDQKTHGKGGAAGRTIENGDDFKIMLADDYISARGDRPTGDYAGAYKALVSERLAARMSDIPAEELVLAGNGRSFELFGGDTPLGRKLADTQNPEQLVAMDALGNFFTQPYDAEGTPLQSRGMVWRRGGTPEAEAIARQLAVGELVKRWATTSNDADAIALSVQRAAEAEFGITGSKVPSEYENVPTARQQRLNDSVDRHYAKHEKTLRAFVRAQYDETQAMFARAGVTDLVVHRGRNEPESVAQSIPEGGTQVTARLRPMSSWSTDRAVAEQFAGQTVDPGRNGVIMTAKVPVKQVISTPSTGNGCLGEAEVVILGPSIDANMTFFDQFAYEYYNE